MQENDHRADEIRWFWWVFCSDGWRKVVVPLSHNRIVCLLVGCLLSQQHASVSRGQICLDNFTCCHTEIEVADQTFYLTQSQTRGRPVPALTLWCQAPGRVATVVSIFKSLVCLNPGKSHRKRDSNPGSSAPEAEASPQGQRGGTQQGPSVFNLTNIGTVSRATLGRLPRKAWIFLSVTMPSWTTAKPSFE